jgi:hypothetical protein
MIRGLGAISKIPGGTRRRGSLVETAAQLHRTSACLGQDKGRNRQMVGNISMSQTAVVVRPKRVSSMLSFDKGTYMGPKLLSIV